MHGPAALSLRAVARSLGMTVQALHHYFPNRDALVPALITKAYGDLADALQAAADRAGPDVREPRLVVVAEAYRERGVARPEHFQLLYGTPPRSYAAPAEGPTTRAVRRMGTIFQRELIAGFTREQGRGGRAPAVGRVPGAAGTAARAGPGRPAGPGGHPVRRSSARRSA
ncbi:TetR/AcrR family transcriptional regulator [Streptomyces lusitanus]|uniref:TetR/AcrR family transcriptional regulator n=1 Tax=Streptomyces lusitanus TaxID=68232 RepID=UPI003605D39A